MLYEPVAGKKAAESTPGSLDITFVVLTAEPKVLFVVPRAGCGSDFLVLHTECVFQSQIWVCWFVFTHSLAIDQLEPFHVGPGTVA